jgi:hypothetical protein
MILHNFLGNFSALFAAGLFGASVVATRVAIQEIPSLERKQMGRVSILDIQ